MGYTRRQSSIVTWRAAGALAGVLVALTFPSAADAQRAAVSPDSTVLRVAVDDSATGQPISDARVELYSLSTIRRSDDRGRATFRGVRVGYQRIRVSAIGYQPVNRIIAVSSAEPTDSTATLIEL